MTPQAAITAWLSANKDPAHPWLHVAERLANSIEMDLAWPSISKHCNDPIRIVKMVDGCFRDSIKDADRLSAIDEKNSLKEVQRAAKDLLTALQGAQLLGVAAPLCEIDKEAVYVAWTTGCAQKLDNPDGNAIPVLSLPELLRFLQSQCADLLNGPPPKSVTRKSENETLTVRRAFVIRLSACFREKCAKSMPTNFARITNAIFQMDDSLSARDVEKILTPLKKLKRMD